MPFYPNEIQEKIIQDGSNRKMILKARQFGVSTGEIIRMFDWVCFNHNATACILAHEQDSIKKLFRIAQRAYKFWPEALLEFRPELDRGGGSKYEMYFPSINSRIYCDLESRGDTIGWLHVSEAAFMKDSSKLKSTLQAVPITTGIVTLETTANGMANHYFDMWNDPDQPYKKHFYPWFIFNEYQIPLTGKLSKFTEDEHLLVKKAKRMYGVDITPEQINFRRLKKSELKTSSFDKTRVTFEQEYPEDDNTCFLSSGDAVMDLFKIKKAMEDLPEPIEDRDGVRLYKSPVRGRRYICGADPAEGVKKDFSVAIMIDAETCEVVAVARGQWKPSLFAEKLNALSRRYSSPGRDFPLLAVERNNHGHAVLLALDDILGYPNIYVHPDEKLGWRTDGVTRPVMMDNFIDAVEDGYMKVNDRDILNECLTLIDNAGKIEAANGKHDDCITASAIALQVRRANSLSIYDDIDLKIRS